MSIYKGSEPALLGGSAVMDDEVTLYSTWSSQKIKDEIENGGAGLNKEVVTALPTDPRDISDRTIYMVPNGESEGETLYDKYIRDTINNRWEKLNADSDAVKSGDFIQLLKDNTDTSLSATSEKPVQNKVVKEALDARYTKTEIDAKLSSTYKAAGSVATIAALPAADAAHLGYVYNVEAAFTSTANFKEGAGKSYPAGSNVAIVLDGTDYKYDVLAGFVDISGKADKATTLAGYGITDAAPSSHVSDTTKHITAEERTAWNGKVSSEGFIQLLKDNTDTTLNATSEKPVQNKAVKAAIDAIVTQQGILPKVIITRTHWGNEAGITITATNGVYTVSGVTDAEGRAELEVNAFGEWVFSATHNGKTMEAELHVSEVKEYSLVLDWKRYGYRVKLAESNPSNRVEYILDAVGMTPAAMDFSAGKFNYGSWGDKWFITKNKPVMLKSDGTEDYDLNPDDYSKKLDGTASDVANTAYDGNAMSALPTSWVKRYQENGYLYVIFCEHEYDDDYKAYAHTDKNGTVKEFAYAPMFKGSLINSKLRSLSGQRPDNSRQAAPEVTSATANGEGWNILYWSMVQLVSDLCTLIAKTDNSQAAFGQGHTDGGSSASNLYTTGGLNTKGQFYGMNSNSAVKVFHIENYWGDRWDRVIGLVLVNGVYKVKMTPEGSGYNLTGADYTTVPTTTLSGTSGGYIINSKETEYGRLPEGALSGSDATYECDGCWFNNSGTMVSLFGGNCYHGSRCGSRCLSVNDAASASHWSFGASVSFV